MDLSTILLIGIGTVVLIFFGLLACICCPICCIAKLCQKRTRGVVYENGGNGRTHVRQEGRNLIITSSQPTSNNAQQNRNTPNQQQQQPQQHVPYPQQQQQYPLMPTGAVHPYPQYPMYPGPGVPGAQPYPSVAPVQAYQALPDLPPPYPGLARDNDAMQTQPPYNPEWSSEQAPQHFIANMPSAPPPDHGKY